jgi:hypothetical protein
MKIYVLGALGALVLFGAGCGQGVALSVSAAFTDATGAVVYTGGLGGSELNAVTPPLSGAPVISAFVNGDGVDPIDLQTVAVSSLAITVPAGSVCAAKSRGCAGGSCTATVTWSALGACAFDVVAGTAEGDVDTCMYFVLTKAGSGEFDAANDKALALCAD